ncbi:MAG TPA: S53 family peptidase [Stellaceae bacterium]|nr:S53 family peptidase [Stellaceae bacterium]
MSAVALAVSTGSLAAQQPRHEFKQGIENLKISDGKLFHFSVHLKTKDAASVELVRAYFSNFGFKTKYIEAANAIHLTGTLAQAQSAGHFSYKLQNVGENRSIARHDSKPTFTAAIDALVSSDTFGGIGIKAHSMIAYPRGDVTLLNETTTGYTPADIAALYDLGPIAKHSIDGTGQTVYILNCGFVKPADIEFFDTTYSLPGTTDTNFLTQVPVDGGPYYTVNSTTYTYYLDEAFLDVERVHATAPGAAVRNYSIPPTCYLNEFNDMLDQVIADVGTAAAPGAALTVSYGLGEGIYDYYGYGVGGAKDLLTPSAQEYAAVLATGTPIFASSGDDGSIFYEPGPAPGQANFVTDVEYPASDPSVISVGGTTLLVTPKGARAHEWSWSGDAGRGNAGGSGGGVSASFPEPGYQTTVSGTSGKGKNIPDVSLDADPFTGYAFYDSLLATTVISIGGTSASSPTWAGFMALVEQARVKAGKKPLTKVAAKLYHHAADFTDITVGANGFYRAEVGYDHVTGLGVPDFFKLYQDLKEAP